MEVRLIVLDLDGTTLRDDKSISAYTLETLEECRRRGILINAVDDRDACSFLFPALVRRGDLSIGICTAGSSPSLVYSILSGFAMICASETCIPGTCSWIIR